MLAQIVSIASEIGRSTDAGLDSADRSTFLRRPSRSRRTSADGRDFRWSSAFGERFHVPVIMDNDANVGALGEAIYGAGRGARPLFYMTLSTGIGGGIVLEDSTVYRGADSYAGEMGHITLKPGGPECLCGSRGCFERLCCGMWLERDYGKTAKELMQDPGFVERYVVDLAQGLKAAVMMLNPARIVIGGGIAKAGDALFVPLRAELRRQVTAWSRARLDVVPAGLGDDSVLYGLPDWAPLDYSGLLKQAVERRARIARISGRGDIRRGSGASIRVP